jgi:hypothetical protein
VDQEYVPTDAEYYQPTDRGIEAQVKQRLDELRRRKKKPAAGDKPAVRKPGRPGEPGDVSPPENGTPESQR